ncbi:hypothetical protein [Candidatus Thiodictyon syntrophicum]|jgi:hypothetical protein|uniref:hypothetical protein n=1 Tax=Candidatus Thiodictyon syntrophicum TaxID=1166950 RepID=UPI0012FE1695|nr:hypothetical protein [Candidatus Thiodictyon syntrophicum]
MGKKYHKNQLIEFCDDCKRGFFITINSSIRKPIAELSENQFNQFRNDVLDIRKALNIYCYGKHFKERQRSFKGFTAIEVGWEGDLLHAHLLLLNHLATNRTTEDIERRLKDKIRPYCTIAESNNSIQVKKYDPGKLEKCVDYCIKQQYLFIERFRESNIT